MRYFTEDEFMCVDANVFDKMNKQFIEKLDKARGLSSVPYIITSSYRTPEHNLKEGGSSTSSHLIGLAVDLSAPTSFRKFAIVKSLLLAGFKRIGIGSNFIHCDLDIDKPQQCMWTY